MWQNHVICVYILHISVLTMFLRRIGILLVNHHISWKLTKGNNYYLAPFFDSMNELPCCRKSGRHSNVTPSLVALLSVMVTTSISHTNSSPFSAGASRQDNVQQRFDQRSRGQENARTPVTDERWYLKIRKTLPCFSSGWYLTDFAGEGYFTKGQCHRAKLCSLIYSNFIQLAFLVFSVKNESSLCRNFKQLTAWH